MKDEDSGGARDGDSGKAIVVMNCLPDLSLGEGLWAAVELGALPKSVSSGLNCLRFGCRSRGP
jgi:hypothetical protein